MAAQTRIEWADATWNPIVGCQKITAGCTNCYAIRDAWRIAHNPNQKLRAAYEGVAEKRDGKLNWTGRVNFLEDRLLLPTLTRRPTRWFVDSMSDLFYERVTDAMRDQVFAVMALCPQHVFIVLTKRPEAMRIYMSDRFAPGIEEAVGKLGLKLPAGSPARRIADRAWSDGLDNWPPPNLWAGPSCTDQDDADRMIPEVLATPLAKRIVSFESLLRPVDLSAWIGVHHHPDNDPAHPAVQALVRAARKALGPTLDWIIAGFESGPGARWGRVEHLRSIVRQCEAAGVPCFVKQMGHRVIDRNDAGFDGEGPTEWDVDPFDVEHDIHGYREEYQGADCLITLADRKGGDPAEWPEALRVRQVPT